MRGIVEATNVILIIITRLAVALLRTYSVNCKHYYSTSVQKSLGERRMLQLDIARYQLNRSFPINYSETLEKNLESNWPVPVRLWIFGHQKFPLTRPLTWKLTKGRQ